MIAYNRKSLDNLDFQREAAEALKRAVISAAEYERIRQAHPVRLYSPNFFVRFGLFVLTVVAVVCGAGLYLLVNLGSGERGIGSALIFFGVLCYVVLELFIHLRHFYRAGVDDALIWMATGMVFLGTNLVDGDISVIPECCMVAVLAGWGFIRYEDRILALLAFGAFVSAVYHLILDKFASGSAILPFVIMAVAVATYLVFTKLALAERCRHYHSCLMMLRMAALVTFYISGNFYVAQKVNESIHGQKATVPLGWLWWAFTCIVPVFYIVAGLKRKDVVLLWTGLGLVAGTIFTIRYYYHLLPAELAMILGGIILIVGAYGLIRYLREPKEGFTSAASDEPHVLENLQVESLVVAEAFQSIGQPVDQAKGFGGGSAGGGGASGSY
jgi:hypothetical protein